MNPNVVKELALLQNKFAADSAALLEAATVAEPIPTPEELRTRYLALVDRVAALTEPGPQTRYTHTDTCDYLPVTPITDDEDSGDAVVLMLGLEYTLEAERTTPGVAAIWWQSPAWVAWPTRDPGDTNGHWEQVYRESIGPNDFDHLEEGDNEDLHAAGKQLSSLEESVTLYETARAQAMATANG